MKRLTLAMIFILTTLSFARDFDYRSKMEFKEVIQEGISPEEKMSRMSAGEYSLRQQWDLKEREISFEQYSGFHQELVNQNRGSERR